MVIHSQDGIKKSIIIELFNFKQDTDTGMVKANMDDEFFKK